MAERGILTALNGLLKGVNQGLARRDEREKAERDSALKEKEIGLKTKSEENKSEYYKSRMADQEERTDILSKKLGIERQKVNQTTESKDNIDFSRLSTNKNNLLQTMSKEDDKIKELTEDLGSGLYKKKPEVEAELKNQLELRKQNRQKMQQEIDGLDGQMNKINNIKTTKKTGQKTSKIESFNAIKTLQMIESLDDPDDILNALEANDFSIHNAEEREELKQAALSKILGGQKVAAGSLHQGPSDGRPSTGKFYDDAEEEMNEAVDKIPIHTPKSRQQSKDPRRKA
jgi:hypothetical protein